MQANLPNDKGEEKIITKKPTDVALNVLSVEQSFIYHLFLTHLREREKKRTESSFKLARGGSLRSFFFSLPTTRLKSNICGGDDGVCNDGHKLWQSQCETTAKISRSRDLGRPDNSNTNQLHKLGTGALHSYYRHNNGLQRQKHPAMLLGGGWRIIHKETTCSSACGALIDNSAFSDTV